MPRTPKNKATGSLPSKKRRVQLAATPARFPPVEQPSPSHSDKPPPGPADEKVRSIIQARGGIVIREPFYDLKHYKRIGIRCAAGHQWEPKTTSISYDRRPKWCPSCSGKQKLTIAELQATAEARGGRLVSTEYISKTPLTWECAMGHQFSATGPHVRAGLWCPDCSLRKKLTLDELQKLAEARGGSLLSESYQNCNEPLEWQCAEGHRWTADARHVKMCGTWCLACSGKQKHTLDEMRALAAARGGSLLSTEYKGNSQPLIWQCSEGHQWETCYSHVKNGHWCSECRFFYVREELIRTAMEAFLGERFPKTSKLPWLGRLELDGYNDAPLKLAFEHQGIQHRQETPLFHRGPKDFQSQLERDARKRQLCAAAGVTLLEFDDRVPLIKLRQTVRQELVARGYSIRPEADQMSEEDFYADFRRRAPAIWQQQHHENVVAAARLKGGECLSDSYTARTVPMLFRCGAGHTFQRTPEIILKTPSGRNHFWCTVCYPTRSYEKSTSDAEIEDLFSRCPGYTFLRIIRRAGMSKRFVVFRCPAGLEWTARWRGSESFNKRGVPVHKCKDCRRNNRQTKLHAKNATEP